jgi:hypothetical protein
LFDVFELEEMDEYENKCIQKEINGFNDLIGIANVNI